MELSSGAQPVLPRPRRYPARRPTRLGAWLAQARRDTRMLLDGLRGVHPSPLLPRPAGRRDGLRAEPAELAEPAEPAEPAGPAEPQAPPEGDPTPGPEGGAVVLVHLGGRVHTVIVHPDQTILDATLAAGLPMPFSCTLGGCGACKVKLLAGTVDMEEPNCLRPRERASGMVLTCVGRPLGPVTIEVDEE